MSCSYFSDFATNQACSISAAYCQELVNGVLGGDSKRTEILHAQEFTSTVARQALKRSFRALSHPFHFFFC